MRTLYRNSFSPGIGLLLLFLLSTSVMLATIFYSYDKAIVIAFNAQRNSGADWFWLNTKQGRMDRLRMGRLSTGLPVHCSWEEKPGE